MYPCLFCTRRFANQSTVIDHCSRIHGLRDAVDVYGTTCPACGEPSRKLGFHTSRMHHLQVSLLFARMEKDGDPHGVVRARLLHFDAIHQRALNARTRAMAGVPLRSD